MQLEIMAAGLLCAVVNVIYNQICQTHHDYANNNHKQPHSFCMLTRLLIRNFVIQMYQASSVAFG